MDELSMIGKMTAYVKKYRYVILVCLIGIFLMLLPEREKQQTVAEPVPQETVGDPDTAQLLSNVLQKIQGAGNVEVMLTVAAGAQTIYQENTKESPSQGATSLQTDTVIITSSDKKQTGLVKQVIPEKYLGAIIVCQGGDDPAVRLAIVEAVSDVTGLSTDKISVLKME